MNLNVVIDAVVDFYHNHKLYALLIVGALGLFAYLKPKSAFRLAVALAFAAAALYILSLFGDSLSTSVKHKEEGIKKSTQLPD